ncbi:Ubiquitin-related domain,Myosin head, motor domain,Rho GTPase-activating protein domain,P-loop [Cinara cedri]|uniref:Ubiquitin-related domain,Myosin head, motor domain,Rho GTPase-activating protein domain,P-loop n=1 Tax=Cinara cedri TaxID=506608 RepID=A0A5E4NP15_9HEMI|nr:Ubiquitin-related domain,Myosin head, motor domain,Rho GTPase-activating protein domain,P-loop [Cinara cedri]
MGEGNQRYIVQVFVGALSQCYEALSVEASKQTTSDEIVSCIVERLSLSGGCGTSYTGTFELAEVVGDALGRECKERRLGPTECPVAVMLLWPQPRRHTQQEEYYRFYLREKLSDSLWADGFTMDPQLIRDYFYRFLYQPQDREYPDLCQLPDLNEQTLLDNLRARFLAGHIYTYVGSILIAVNPFKFHPIYNPKYVKLYQNRRLGPELPPHIFAIADAAYHCMLRERRNQCIVISGESGSGKTESTNFLLHHLTALSQKGSHGSGVEQTILSAGPVLEAFGNAKTAHNNNSSRFGKFIQVNYKENGMVHGAVVQKYLLEKSRICSQGQNERNYHVFYYLLNGASDTEKESLHLHRVDYYNYLNGSGCYTLGNLDEKYEFSRLKQSMEMVGFTPEKQRRLFAVLSAVLLLGNVDFQPRKSAYHHDEAVAVRNPEIVFLISQLLRVKQETLLAALTAKRAKASGETLVINYKLPEAIAARDAMAKCLYGALFDWIVLQVNHALLSKKDTLRDHQGNSIGVLDIFGFEDFGACNSFEQFCINYANEHLQYYFNQHVFKYEQEEYRKEGIKWSDIDFLDNTGCLQMIEGKPNGLLCVLDDQCNFPGSSCETLLQKFNSVHKDNKFYEMPQRKENAFIVRHYAGRVKYQVFEMREKNLDLMRQDIVGVLKNSSMAFVRELVGADPVAVFRWAIVRAFFRGYFSFQEAGRRHRQSRVDGVKASSISLRFRNSVQNDSLIRYTPKFPINSTSYGGGYVINVGKKLASNPNNEQNVYKNNSAFNKFTNLEIVNSNKNINKEDIKTRANCKSTDEDKVIERATQIVMKNKSFRPKDRGNKGLKNLQSVKTLAGRIQIQGSISSKARKQPLTVTAQFQMSLNSLMDTLNQANPFFIRCIKSNSNKVANMFDHDTVQRQLRYTGMLETVRIRQAGYNVRLSYEEFIQLYRILLPKGLNSNSQDVRNFLQTLNLDRDNYQIGESKVFLRECEKLKLDYRLHQQIMASIVTIQRWFRTLLQRRQYLRITWATETLQSWWRMILAQRLVNKMRMDESAAIYIQSAWRKHRVSNWYKNLRRSVITLQAHSRGYLARKKFSKIKNSKKSISVPQINNSKESSQEELHDSESSGGAKGDSESEADPFVQTKTTNNIKDDQFKAPKRKVSARRLRIESHPTDVHKERSSKTDGPVNEGTAFSDSELDDTHLKQQPVVWKRRERTSDTSNKRTLLTRTPHVTSEPIAPVRLLNRLRVSNTEPAPETSITNEKELKRRNSDGSTTHAGKAEEPKLTYSPSFELLEWKGTTMFTIAGHRFRKLGRFTPQDKCTYCNKLMDAFLTQGHKCSDCKKLFHTKCIQNGGVLQMPCIQQNGGNRPTNRRKPRKPVSAGNKAHITPNIANNQNNTTIGKFSLTGTSEFTDRTDKIISDVRELKMMQDFITKKLYKIEREEVKKPSLVDRIFKQALREFKENLIATYSMANKQGNGQVLNIKYKDLIANFLHVIETVCGNEKIQDDFPVTLCVNAFRGFMNEFMNQNRVDTEKPSKTKRKKEKKQKSEDHIIHGGHVLQMSMINIPTACEVCTSFFLWPIERSLVCRNCKLTCHKKCYPRANQECVKDMNSGGNMQSKGICMVKGKVFGRPLGELDLSKGKVPAIVEGLITFIEIHGMYKEGIYRKPGLTTRVNELKELIDNNDVSKIELEKYQVHVLASVLKSFLREMPEPLLTFDCYDDFIRAASLSEDRVSTLFNILKKLPKVNYDLMERLVFHLARVALHENVNRMNASSLAIVFAPCVLRTNKLVPAQESLRDIEQQTLCISSIISHQMNKIESTMADINTLDTAHHTATHRLSSLRISKVYGPTEGPIKMDEEEKMLVGQIEEIKKEKEKLTIYLPSLRRTNSDDDLLSTDDGSLDDVNASTLGSRKTKLKNTTKKAKRSNNNTLDSDEDPIMV